MTQPLYRCDYYVLFKGLVKGRHVRERTQETSVMERKMNSQKTWMKMMSISSCGSKEQMTDCVLASCREVLRLSFLVLMDTVALILADVYQ